MSLDRRSAYVFKLNSVPTQPEKVRALLKEAIYKLGIELELHSPDKVDVDEIAKVLGVFLSPY